MPDLHPYFKDVAQAFKWYPKIEKQILASAAVINRQYWNVIKVSSEANWEQYRNEILEIAKRRNQPALVEIRRDCVDRYWIIDVDYSLVDSMNQVREVGCIQIDIGNASRLGIVYAGNDGKEHYPVIIHAAVPGGIERYIYAMFDDVKLHLPFWIKPVQVRLLPVSDKYVEFCEKIVLDHPKLRIEIDDRAESVSKKIRNCFKDFVNVYFVVGEEEVKQGADEIEKRLVELEREIANFPNVQQRLPIRVSARLGE